MSDRDRTSRCQGFTPPKELQPVDTTADTRSNTVVNRLIFMVTSTGAA
jgi:hypothetical protein